MINTQTYEVLSYRLTEMTKLCRASLCPDGRYTRNPRLRRLEELTGLLATHVQSRKGPISSKVVTIEEDAQELARRLGVSISTLRDDYMRQISRATGVRYQFVESR